MVHSPRRALKIVWQKGFNCRTRCGEYVNCNVGLQSDQIGHNVQGCGKNKTNDKHRRYRERRKQIKEDLEGRVAVLSARISSLRTTQESLIARNKSLERYSELQGDKEDSTKEQQAKVRFLMESGLASFDWKTRVIS